MNSQNPYAHFEGSTAAAYAIESERAAFIRRTYTHLALAILAFVGLEALLLQTIPARSVMGVLGAGGQWSWLLVLGAFMAVSWLARSWADSSTSVPLQYAGLGLYVVAEAFIFLPMMYMAMLIDPKIPVEAGLVTLMVFSGLTAFVFMTRADFGSWGPYLALAGIAALVICVGGALFGFGLGLWFSVAMVVLLSGYILYDTSNVMHHYQTSQHVAASLALFASIATLLWYIMRIFMSFRDE